MPNRQEHGKLCRQIQTHHVGVVDLMLYSLRRKIGKANV